MKFFLSDVVFRFVFLGGMVIILASSIDLGSVGILASIIVK